MSTTARIEVQNAEIRAAVVGFLQQVLADPEVSALFVPMRQGGGIMPALVTDPARLQGADPLAPAFPFNAARQVAKLTRGDSEGVVAAVLRPCEIRAFVELVKLNQGNADNLLLIGLDCHGALSNREFHAALQAQGGDGLDQLSRQVLRQLRDGGNGGAPLARACQVCEHPAPQGADVTLGLFGVDWERELPVLAQTPSGEGLLNRIGLTDFDAAPLLRQREAALQELLTSRATAREALTEDTARQVDSPAKLAAYLEGCVNCYNCRVACPVCYCKECVFVTDVFDHEPWQYMGWAKRQGALRMPVDTMFYHLTRLAHSSMACVGCGQCSNACPNDIPVMELFRTVGAKTQAAFGYEAGRSLEEAPPMTVFQREEFAEVTSHGH